MSPYYSVFADNAPDEQIEAAISANSTRVSVGPPSPGAIPGSTVYDRDATTWANLKPNVLYHFAGTRLFAVSFDAARTDFVRDRDFHGDGTAYLAAREAPNAIIVGIQVNPGQCDIKNTSCLADPSIAAAMEWASKQSWIDVISVSIAFHANAPDDPEFHAEMARYVAASELAVQSGKTLLNGAGNDGAPPVPDYFNGPPWIIAVGGMDSHSHGMIPESGNTADVVANFTEYVPEFGAGEMRWKDGTSFSTPIVAGTLANALALIHARDPDRKVTPEELRDGLNLSAVRFTATDWQPGLSGRTDPVSDIAGSASVPVVADAQEGWGYVNASLAPAIAQRVLSHDTSVPPEKANAASFQARWQEARERYWATWPRS